MSKLWRLSRREHPRLSLDIESVGIRVSQDADFTSSFEAKVSDLGLGGVGISHTDPFTKQSVVYIKVMGTGVHLIRAVIVWRKEPDAYNGQYRTGLRFFIEDEEQKEMILQFSRLIMHTLTKEKLVEKALSLFASGQKTKLEVKEHLETLIFEQLAVENILHSLSEPVESLIHMHMKLEGKDPSHTKALHQLRVIKQLLNQVSEGLFKPEEGQDLLDEVIEESQPAIKGSTKLS